MGLVQTPDHLQAQHAYIPRCYDIVMLDDSALLRLAFETELNGYWCHCYRLQ